MKTLKGSTRLDADSAGLWALANNVELLKGDDQHRATGERMPDHPALQDHAMGGPKGPPVGARVGSVRFSPDDAGIGRGRPLPGTQRVRALGASRRFVAYAKVSAR